MNYSYDVLYYFCEKKNYYLSFFSHTPIAIYDVTVYRIIFLCYIKTKSIKLCGALRKILHWAPKCIEPALHFV